MDKVPITVEILMKFFEEGIAKGGINLQALEKIQGHTEKLADGFGPELAPFFRDLLLLDPVAEEATPRPDWVRTAVAHVYSSFLKFGLPAKSKDLVERLGCLGGMALNVNHTPIPLENPSAEFVENWNALSKTVSESVQLAQTKANELPSEARSNFYTGFAQGTGKNPMDDKLGLLGSYAQFYFISIYGWREIIKLHTRKEFCDWLDRKLGADVVSDTKRVEHFCQAVGLKFKGRGRPKKNTQT